MPDRQCSIEGIISNECTEFILNNGLVIDAEDFLYELDDFIQEATDGLFWLDNKDKIVILLEKQK